MRRLVAGIMVAAILMAGSPAKGQKRNDWSDLHLNGRIKTLKETFYSASDSSGTIVRGREILYSHAPVRIYTFNDSGFLTEKTEFDSDSTQLKHLYQCDDLGNKTEDVVRNPDGSIREITFYSYDEQGRLEKCENKQVSKSEKLLRKEDYLKVRGPFVKRVYRYDAKGNTNCETIYDVHGSRSIVYTCDGKGNITGHKYLDEEGKTLKSLAFTFDDRKNLLESQQFDRDGNLQSRFVYKYDSKNLLTGETEYAPDDRTLIEVVYEYEFDDQNNWVRQIAYRDKVPVRIAEREIGYYE